MTISNDYFPYNFLPTPCCNSGECLLLNKGDVMGVFFGGLNGDGFYNDEYSDGGYCDGENGGFEIPPKPINELSLVKTGVETEKAVQYSFHDYGVIWMPKKALSNTYNNIDGWAISIAYGNIKKMLVALQVKHKKGIK